MKKRTIQRMIHFCMGIVLSFGGTTVFADEKEDVAEFQQKRDEVLWQWAEAYGDDKTRFQLLSEDMKKTYFADMVERGNQDCLMEILHQPPERALQESMEVVDFEIKGNDTILYTLCNEEGKQYNRAEYVTIGTDGKVEKNAITHTYTWTDWAKGEKVRSNVDHLSSVISLDGNMVIYPPVVTITGAEEIDRELLPLFLDHLESVFWEGHSSYYIIEMLNIDVTNVKQKDDMTNIDFTLQEVVRRYPKDPDTVGYIRKAKEKAPEEYKVLYREYNQPFYGNYTLRFTGTPKNTESFRLFTGTADPKTGKMIYNWPIQQQFPERDADGAKVLLGTINNTADDYGRILLTINRKQWNEADRSVIDKGYFITSYGQRLTLPLREDAHITCINKGKLEWVDRDAFVEAAGGNGFGRSRLFWFHVEGNKIVEINEFAPLEGEGGMEG